MSDKKDRRFPIAELVRSLLPITLMGRLLAIGIIVWFIDWVFVRDQTLFGSSTLKLVFDFASLLALIPLIYFVYKWARWLTRGMLWRLSRRLVITYLLIGALPMVLVMLLITLIGYTVVMQSSASLVSRQLDGYLAQSRAAAISIKKDLSSVPVGNNEIEQIKSRLQERANSLAPILPDVSITVLDMQSGAPVNLISVKGEDAQAGRTEASDDGEDTPSLPLWPLWLDGREEFHGLVVEEDRSRSVRAIKARHLIRINSPRRLALLLSYPIGENICHKLRLTTDLNVQPSYALRPLILTPSGPQIDQSEVREVSTLDSRAAWPAGSLPIYKPTFKWASGKQMESDVLLIDLSFLLPGHIWWRVQRFQSGSAIGNSIVMVIAVLGLLFASIAMLAIISAIFMTRSITRAVHSLYQGTKRVEGGDLDQEIPIKGDDQIADLSISFNQMTRSVRKLLRVSAEKERLDQEVKIATEVQSRLFPLTVPETSRLDIAPGICIPARSVSGDYYDYMEISPGMIGFVVADVCGKGVSAALMMANLQANLRSQVKAYHEAYSFVRTLEGDADKPVSDEPTRGTTPHPVCRIVQQINQQVSISMIDASYITLFYAEFNERESVLRYTNAGHNPPLLIRKTASSAPLVERLESGGTVLGLFQDYEFVDAEIILESGDVLVAYTDGLIEAHSLDNNEEFGEDRVIETILKNFDRSAIEIRDELLSDVKHWTSNSEQEDDLTLMVFKVNSIQD